MSTIIMSQCWPLQGMTAAQKAVLISLADQANDDGVCWPSVGTIAKRTCLSSRAVQEAVAWLHEARILQREFRAHSSTYYTVVPASYMPEAASPSRRRRKHPAAGVNEAQGVNEAHPLQEAQEGGEPGAGWGVNQAQGGGEPGAPRTVIEPSVEPSVEPSLSLPALSGQPKKGGGSSKSEAEHVRQEACRSIWSAYSAAYESRYGIQPVRNAKVNTQVNDLLKRLGAEAAAVAAYYVLINDAYLIRNCHDFGSLLTKAEAYRTQWATNRQVNGTTARQLEQTQANINAAQQAAENIRGRKGGKPNAFL